VLDFSQLLTFAIASAIIILSPGADSFVLLRISHSQGIKAGMRALWGINLGNTSQALLMISGVGLVVSRFEPAILALKILGGLYMAYLAVMAARAAWRARGQAGADSVAVTNSAGAADSSTSLSGEAARVKKSSPFLQGLISNITNPKPLLFYLAFFPLFIGSATNVPLQLSMLSGIFIGFALIWQTVIVYGAVKLSETIKSPKFNLVMDVICAIAFAAIAVFIFAEI
jgi:threonine/homoserine/homoserine lactone efflux protein